MEVYAGYLNEIVREKCSSGGIFICLARRIIETGGVVYGVVMSEDNYTANFFRAVKMDEVIKMCGSKYLQANLGDTFSDVKQDLNNNKTVLFSGTACQINGLKCYLSKEYYNLICVDIICHGVPSPDLWKTYLKEREKTIGKCNSINFRSKESGWYESGVKENTYFTEQKKHSYMRLFLQDYCLRPSCYECVAKVNKMSDITIGDFWGVRKIAPELDDDRGVSVIVLRSLTGRKLFEVASRNMILKHITYQEAIDDNPCERISVARPWQRRKFYIDMNSMEYEKLVNKYLGTSVYRKAIRIMKQILNNVIRLGI